MDITLKNSEVADNGLHFALNTLMGKQLPVSIGWQLSELKEYLDKRLKKFVDKRMELFKQFGAKEQADGSLSFDKDNPAPPELKKEIESLNEIEGRVQMASKFTLPEKDAAGKDIQYEPFILFGLKKFFVERPSSIKEIEE